MGQLISPPGSGDAEPGLQPEVRRVREELEAVERESADR
jgi:hypothetical protein